MEQSYQVRKGAGWKSGPCIERLRAHRQHAASAIPRVAPSLLAATSLSPDSGVQLHTHGDKVWILVNLDVNAVPDKKGGTMGAGGAAAGGDAGCCVIS